MRDTFTISQLTREFQITARTIRHYEDQGLLRPSRQGNTRVYDGRDRARLKLALRAKLLGFSLSQVRDLFTCFDAAMADPQGVPELLRVMARYREELEMRGRAIDQMLDEFAFFENKFRNRARPS